MSCIEAKTQGDASCQCVVTYQSCHPLNKWFCHYWQKSISKENLKWKFIYTLPISIAREPFCYGTPDDVFHKLSKTKVLTTIDFSKECWYLELDETSSFLITFKTLIEKFKITKEEICLTVVCDTFKDKLNAIFYFLTDIADDVIIMVEYKQIDLIIQIASWASVLNKTTQV